MNTLPQIVALRAVAQAFGDLLPQVVFVGGATVALYAMLPQVPTPRPTDDVDRIIDVVTYAQFTALEEKLHERGFRNDTSSRVLVAGFGRPPTKNSPTRSTSCPAMEAACWART